MKPRLIFWKIGLIAAIGLYSCAPAVTSPSAAPTDASSQGTVPATVAPVDPSTPEATASAPAQPVEIQAVATSRGPNLEATNPATVNLASGQLQLVEFFRFT